jgi:pentose-5-phosphate-3-epimerase
MKMRIRLYERIADSKQSAEKPSRGTRIAIKIDGQLNASLIKACAQMGVTKRDYLKDALIRRLIAGGFV